MMKTAKSTLIATALLVSTVALAGPGMGPGNDAGDCASGPQKTHFMHRGGMEDRIEHMTARLQLNDEQRDAVRAVMDGARPQLREIRDKLRDNRQAIRTLTQNGGGDDAGLRTLAEQQGNYVTDMIMLHAKMQGDINKVLTAEQRQQLKEDRESRHHGHRFGGRW